MIAIEAAQDFLNDNFAQWILDMGIEVTEMSDDGATLEIPITPHIERVGGIVCGQALSSLADTAMVFACFSAMGVSIDGVDSSWSSSASRPNHQSCMWTASGTGTASSSNRRYNAQAQPVTKFLLNNSAREFPSVGRRLL